MRNRGLADINPTKQSQLNTQAQISILLLVTIQAWPSFISFLSLVSLHHSPYPTNLLPLHHRTRKKRHEENIANIHKMVVISSAMASLPLPAIYDIVSASVSFLSIPLVIAFQVISFKRLPIGRMGSTGPIPVPIRLARVILQIALPVYLVYVPPSIPYSINLLPTKNRAIILWTVPKSIRAAMSAGARPPPGKDPMLTTVYLAMTGKFLQAAANIGTGLALWYAASTTVSFYRNANRDRGSVIARARAASQKPATVENVPDTDKPPTTTTKKRFLLLHIVPGAAVAFCLLALEAGYFGRQVDDVTRSRQASRQRQTSPLSLPSYRAPSTQTLHWPLLVIDLILLLPAVACVLGLFYRDAISVATPPAMRKVGLSSPFSPPLFLVEKKNLLSKT